MSDQSEINKRIKEINSIDKELKYLKVLFRYMCKDSANRIQEENVDQKTLDNLTKYKDNVALRITKLEGRLKSLLNLKGEKE